MAKYINARDPGTPKNKIAKKGAKIGALATGEKLDKLSKAEKATEAGKRTAEAATALKMLGIII